MNLHPSRFHIKIATFRRIIKNHHNHKSSSTLEVKLKLSKAANLQYNYLVVYWQARPFVQAQKLTDAWLPYKLSEMVRSTYMETTSRQSTEYDHHKRAYSSLIGIRIGLIILILSVQSNCLLRKFVAEALLVWNHWLGEVMARDYT